jgi:MFS family permease
MTDEFRRPSAPIENQDEPAGPKHQPGKGGHRAMLFIVFLVVFIDLLGFGIVLPLLPLYAVDFLKPLLPGEENRPLRGMILGLLMSSFSAMQFLFAPFWGRISDRIGRRPILLMGLAGSVVFYTLFGLASEIGDAGALRLALILLFVARLGAGIAGATISTAQAVIADITPSEGRSRGMAMIGAAFGIGFTFGPLLGFASLFVPLKGAPGFAAAGFSLIALLLGTRMLPETLRPGNGSAHRHWIVDWPGLKAALRTPSVGILVMTFFLATFAFGGLESTLALVNKLLLNPEADLHEELTLEAAKTTERKNFLIFAYVGLVLVLANLGYRRLLARPSAASPPILDPVNPQAIALGRAQTLAGSPSRKRGRYKEGSHRSDEVLFLRIGTVLMATGLAAAVAILLFRDQKETTSTILLCAFAAMTLAVIGFACLTPSVQGLISRRSDPAKQGEILGVNQSAAAMARILGPLIGLSLFDLSASHVWPYVLGAGMLVVVFLLSFRIQQD